MVRTQIYITDEERKKLRVLARQSGRKQSELIRNAIDDYLSRVSAEPARDALRNCRGMWRDRKLGEFEVVRKEIEARFET
jgi:predicted DNA-binding protein